MKLFYKNINRLLQFFIALVFITMSVMGSDCEKILVGSGNVPAEMVGNWKLIEQTGTLQDICSDEAINFQSTGVAQLTCPNSTAISRNFTVQNNVLSYTETSVSYDVEFLNNNSNLLLTGRNISRNLKYEKIIAAVSSVQGGSKTDSNNSSEDGK